MRHPLILSCLLFAVIAGSSADDDRHVAIAADSLEWRSAASLPAGADIAVLEGPMNKPGPFTARLRFPADYRLPAHWHPAVERVTVLSGTFHMGLGDRLDTTRGMALGVGDMMIVQPQTRHYAWTTQPTVVQLHGSGPWEIHYVDPADDPRSN
jgi:quercetin dioxygenase-like cupin family protein